MTSGFGLLEGYIDFQYGQLGDSDGSRQRNRVVVLSFGVG